MERGHHGWGNWATSVGEGAPYRLPTHYTVSVQGIAPDVRGAENIGSSGQAPSLSLWGMSGYRLDSEAVA